MIKILFYDLSSRDLLNQISEGEEEPTEAEGNHEAKTDEDHQARNDEPNQSSCLASRSDGGDDTVAGFAEVIVLLLSRGHSYG